MIKLSELRKYVASIITKYALVNYIKTKTHAFSNSKSYLVDYLGIFDLKRIKV